MQTKEQVLKRIKSMINDGGQTVDQWLIEECERLLAQGAINFEEYYDDNNRMILPKIVFVIALENLSRQYIPPESFKKALKDLSNLRHF